MAQPSSIHNGVLHLRQELLKRLELRIAVAEVARDSATRFGNMPSDITLYIILPYIPDLRRSINWMIGEIVEARAAQEDFLDHYAATDSNGMKLVESEGWEITPVLSIAALGNLCSTSGLVAGYYSYAKQVGNWWALQTELTIGMTGNDTQLHVAHPGGAEFVDCFFNGATLQTISDDIEHHEGIITLDDPRYVPILTETFVMKTILPCGLVITCANSHDYALYDPVTRSSVPLAGIDSGCHYDDFGVPIAKSDDTDFFNPFEPAFGKFIPK